MRGIFPDYPSVIRDILCKQGLENKEDAIAHLFEKRISEKRIPFQRINPLVIQMLTQ